MKCLGSSSRNRRDQGCIPPDKCSGERFLDFGLGLKPQAKNPGLSFTSGDYSFWGVLAPS